MGKRRREPGGFPISTAALRDATNEGVPKEGGGGCPAGRRHWQCNVNLLKIEMIQGQI